MTVTHASILSISSVTVVFLLHSGYSLQLVTVGEALSAIFELSSTFLVPLRVQKISRSLADKAGYQFSALPQDEDDEPKEPRAAALDDQYVDMAIAHVGRSGVLTMAFTLVSWSNYLSWSILTSAAPYRTNSALLDACASVPDCTELGEPDPGGVSDRNHRALRLSCGLAARARDALFSQPAACSVKTASAPTLVLCRRRARVRAHFQPPPRAWNGHLERAFPVWVARVGELGDDCEQHCHLSVMVDEGERQVQAVGEASE